MNGVAQSFALIAALVHIGVFPLESLVFRRPAIHQGVFHTQTADVPVVMLWAFNMGFRNLFLGVGTVTGLVALNTGDEVVGRTLVIFCCAYMFLAGITMGVSDMLGMYAKKGDGAFGTVGASLPPLIALVAAAF